MHIKLYDLVDICTVGQSRTILSYIENEYGPFISSSSDKERSDLIINLINDLSSPEKSIHIRGPVAYDKKGVFLHDPNYHVFRIDFDTIGHHGNCVSCDIDFNPHFFAILMEYMIHLNLVRKDHFYCHSSAFEFKGYSILCPSWRNVGKTNILLEFLKDGAKYIGDDWVIVNRDGFVRTLPKRLNLLYYNFRENPVITNALSKGLKGLLEFIEEANVGIHDLNKDILDTLKAQARIRISPYELFKHNININDSFKIDYLFLLTRCAPGNNRVTIKSINIDHVATAIESIINFEQSYFHLCYDVFKAQNGRTNDFLEKYPHNLNGLISDAFSKGTKLFQVTVPSQQSTKQVMKAIKSIVKN